MQYLTFAPRTPGSKDLTLPVQHVAAAAEEEQEKKRLTPAPTPGRPCPHPRHLLPAPCCGSLHTLRGPRRAANFRFNHAGEGTNSVSVRLCFAAATLSLLCARVGRSRSGERNGFRLRAPGEAKLRGTGVHRCRCRKAPRS